jgi:tetratricopeptide (TPR) repeat protein
MTAQEMVQQALAHHQSGRRAEAEALYRRALQREPGNPAVMALLGSLLIESARRPTAADAIQALELCTKATRLVPHVPQFHHALGTVLMHMRRWRDAADAFQKSIQCRRDYADGHFGLGRALANLGEVDAAINALRTAASLRPNVAPAQLELAAALRRAGRVDEALNTALAATRIDSRSAWAFNVLGLIHTDRREYEQALQALQRAIALQPDFAEAYMNLAQVYHLDRDDLMEAIAACRRTTELRPDYAEGHANLGILLAEDGQLDEAMAEYRRAMELNPESNDAHWNYGLALLLTGDFDRGWYEFDRGRVRAANDLKILRTHPEWNGEDLRGKTILLYGEQGLGDTLQFVRYAPLVAARGGRVILGCQRELARLLANFPGVDQIVPGDAPVPPFDLHCSLLSLPRIFRTTADSIPGGPSYLKADPALLETWSNRLGPREPGVRRIGLVWAGNPNHKNDLNRSMKLEHLAGLAAIERVQLYSLQKAPAAAAQLRAMPQLNVIDHTAELNDFADTAALISQLDLVITVDTSVAHLSGALGAETWLMLPTAPDWRWLLNRDTSPWYPSMRLFRQTRRRDWSGVADQLLRRFTSHS